MREDEEAAPPRPRLVERICEDASGCDRPARPNGRKCFAHAQRDARKSKKRGAIARRYKDPWEWLAEAAVALGDARPAERIRAEDRLRRAARSYVKWLRAGGKLGPSTLDKLAAVAVEYKATPVNNPAAWNRARERLIEAARECAVYPWERLRQAALAYSDADDSNDKEWRRVTAALRDAAGSYIKWERAGGRA